MRNSKFRYLFAKKIRHKLGLVFGNSGKEHDELFAPVTGNGDVRSFDLKFLEKGGDPYETVVSGMVPVGVVELLEVVHVEKQHGNGDSFLGGFVPFVLVPDFEHAPVVNAGQSVGGSEFLEFLVGFAKLRLEFDASGCDAQIGLQGEHFSAYLLLEKVRVSAGLQAHGHVVFVGEGSKEDDERAVVFGQRFDEADFMGDLETVAVGKRDVQKDDVGPARTVLVHRFRLRLRGYGPKPERSRRVDEALQDRRTVFYDKEVGVLVHASMLVTAGLYECPRLCKDELARKCV